MFTGPVRLRLLRDDDRPATNPHNFTYLFGLQDKAQVIVPPTILADGRLAFDFSLDVKPGKAGQPVFTGCFASGPVDDRFVYLSWRAIERGDYINRVKTRLSSLTWDMIDAARQGERVLTADMSGRGPGDAGKRVIWSLQQA